MVDISATLFDVMVYPFRSGASGFKESTLLQELRTFIDDGFCQDAAFLRSVLPLSHQVRNASLRLLQSTHLFLYQTGQARSFVVSSDGCLATSRQPKLTNDANQLLLELRSLLSTAVWSDDSCLCSVYRAWCQQTVGPEEK